MIRINPSNGEKVLSIEVPALRVGAVAFGGCDLDTLYITTIGYGYANKHEVIPNNDENGGSLFSIKINGVKGIPLPFYKYKSHGN